MPFVKKMENGQLQSTKDSQKIFVGRADELHFFTAQILQPDDPSYNIISLYGDGGVGKSTLLHRFMEEAAAPDYREYCLTALVDERQANAASMLEKFAEQLHLAGEFKKAVVRYREAIRKFQSEQETMSDAVLQHAPDFAGAAVEGVPIFGPLLREGMKVTTEQALKEYRNSKQRQDTERQVDPIGDLTRAFINELNRLADSLVTLGIQRRKRQHRIILIFDTFEQLAVEAAPWLLDYFLRYDISSNIVLITAGRIPLASSLPNDPKRWLPYTDTQMIYSIPLNSFNEEETRTYLEQRGITEAQHINRIWQLSHGLPLYLSLLTANPAHEVDPTADVVDNFLRWIPEHEELKRRLLLDGALFSRPFNQDELSALTYIPEQERSSLYRWLIKQPFIIRSPQDGHYSYHEVAQDLFSRHLYQYAPSIYYATRRMLAGFYQEHLESTEAHTGKDYHRITEWCDLSIALAQQLFLLPESSSHYSAIEQLLEIYEHTHQDEEIGRVLRDISIGDSAQQANAHTRMGAETLRAYIEAEPFSEEQLEASGELLAYIEEASTFAANVQARIYANRGVMLRNLKKSYQQSLDAFHRAIELDTSYTWAYGNRGITYRYMKQDELALVDLNTALAMDMRQDWIYASRGEVYRHLAQYDKAIADFDQAIKLDPDYANAYLSRARVYRLRKQPELALQDIDRAIALAPSGRSYAQRGEVYRALRQDRQALADYTRAIEMNPEYAWAYGTRGLVHFQLQEYAAALADFHRAIKINPNYPWAYAHRGRLYRHMQNYQQAIEDFDRALKLDPVDAWAYSHRGLTYVALREYKQALADFERAIELEPDKGRYYGRRGSAYLGLNRVPEAQQDFARNSQMAVWDTWAAWMSVWLLLCLNGKGEEQQAGYRERLERISARDPHQYYSYVSLAVDNWLRGESNVAMELLNQAIQHRPGAWDAIFWQGMLLVEQGQLEGAEVIQQALKLGMPACLLVTAKHLEKTEFYQRSIQPLLPIA